MLLIKYLPYIDIYRTFQGGWIKFDDKMARAPSARTGKDWHNILAGKLPHRSAFEKDPLLISAGDDFKTDQDIVIISPKDLSAYVGARQTIAASPGEKAFSLSSQLLPLWHAARKETDPKAQRNGSCPFILTTPKIHIEKKERSAAYVLKGSFMIYDKQSDLILFIRQTHALGDLSQNALGCFAAESLDPWKTIDVKNGKVAAFAARKRIKDFIGNRLPIACLET